MQLKCQFTLWLVVCYENLQLIFYEKIMRPGLIVPMLTSSFPITIVSCTTGESSMIELGLELGQGLGG